jgi:hypothetical protein
LIDQITRAISLARAHLPQKSSFEDIVSQAIAYLPAGTSSFERGVVSGMVLFLMRGLHH